jgi:ribonuclease HI
MKSVTLACDGACKGNPGVGGWGAVLSYGTTIKTINGASLLTTNNRMELTAVIKGLEALKYPVDLTIIVDSNYVMKGITEWLPKWLHNGWKTSSKLPVKTQDLWEELNEKIKEHKVTWQWVKGHTGHPLNEAADSLANEAIANLKPTIFKDK